MSKQVNYNENLVAGAAIRDDKGRRISKLFEASHPKMTVGYAKNLIMPDTPTEQEFNFRQSGGGVIEDGVAVIDKVKGNSVVWNQLVKNGNFADGVTGWNFDGSSSVSNNEATVTATTSVTGAFCELSIIKGHKYLVESDVKVSESKSVRVYFGTSVNNGIIIPITTANLYVKCGGIIINAVQQDRNILQINSLLSVGETITIKNVYCIDLTQMFGAGNEPSTVEEYLQRKPVVEDEYAYNEGTIVNNKVEKVVTTGRNLWNEEWELGTIAWSGVELVNNTRIRSSFVPIFANTTYYLRCGSVRYEVFFYDANKSFISYCPSSVANGTFTTPNGAVYLRFTTNSNYTETTYNHDICINLSDPAINNKYFPYEEHTLDLSWVKDIKDTEGVKLFEDGMKSAGDAFDEAAKGKAIKRIGVVDLGSLDWKRDILSNGNWAFYNTNAIPSMKYDGSASMVSVKYQTKKLEQAAADTYEIDQIVFNKQNKQLFIVDKSIEQATDFKAAMQGIKLIYELAEPIVVEYDEKNLTYPVVAGGTEEAIASEPSTAFRADIGYGIDAVKTILDLKARVEALEGK